VEKNLVPLNQRGSTIMLPTPENIQRVTDQAAAQREAAKQASNRAAVDFCQQYGIPRDFAFYVQRQEALVLELQRRIELLEAADRSSLTPPHMRNVEKRHA
jgi:hypothetical protein